MLLLHQFGVSNMVNGTLVVWIFMQPTLQMTTMRDLIWFHNVLLIEFLWVSVTCWNLIRINFIKLRFDEVYITLSFIRSSNDLICLKFSIFHSCSPYHMKSMQKVKERKRRIWKAEILLSIRYANLCFLSVKIPLRCSVILYTQNCKYFPAETKENILFINSYAYINHIFIRKVELENKIVFYSCFKLWENTWNIFVLLYTQNRWNIIFREIEVVLIKD